MGLHTNLTSQTSTKLDEYKRNSKTKHTNNVHKKIKLIAAAITLAVAMLAFSVLPTFAATPPEPCFNFNSSTKTITDYYDNEANNASNPACPRDVTIPSTIGGVSVTKIGDSAFSTKQLTSVIIPNSVTFIDDSAFFGNQLTTISIPGSVTFIGNVAFMGNQLVSITIPDSVAVSDNNIFYVQSVPGGTTSADYQASGGDSAVGQAVIDDTIYTQVFVSDPTSFVWLSDTSLTEQYLGIDLNGNGNQTDTLGGNLVNPAHALVKYQDTQGNTLKPTTMVTGTGLTSYLNKDNPTANLALYYKQGDTANLPTPPTIAGYSLASTPPTTLALSNTGANNVIYTYKANSSSGGGHSAIAPITPRASASNNTLPDTGENTAMFTILASLAILVGGAGLTIRRYKLSRQ